jgi:DNA ligase (NAD+)
VVKFFADAGNRAVVRRLRAAGVAVTPAALEPRAALAGRTFVLTGALPGLTRDQAVARIEAAGGRTSDTVSRRTDHLVGGEGAGRKLADAWRLGVRTLDPAAFASLVSAAR